MPQDAVDPWLIAFIVAVAAASLATWLFLLGRPRRLPFLPYEPREPVPWGFAGASLALILLATKLVEFLGGSNESGLPPTITEMAIGVLVQLCIVGGFMFAVVVLSGATARDLGVDSHRRCVARDLEIGILACLAAFVPVFTVQALLVYALGAPTPHPLVTMVEHDRNWVVLAMVFVAAVIVAPVCEEVTFRLLLQGWLEKWEDERLGRRKAAELVASVDDEATTPTLGASGAAVDEPAVATWEPPRVGLFGLPHGWTPILISSVAFALAHLGHGTDPIPLYPLAIILGYIYQRTHRVLPGIVAHALFNLATMVVLWRTVLHAGE